MRVSSFKALVRYFSMALALIVAFAGFAPRFSFARTPTPASIEASRSIVPPGYVITPFGYFHPSCVRAIGTGEKLLADGAIQHADGSIVHSPICVYSHYTARGEAVKPNQATPQKKPTDSFASINGWVEDSELVTTSSYSELKANWPVPAAPSNNDQQVVYFFPGLEDNNDVQSILQPVLGWDAFSDSVWTIASWNCCQDGNVNYSTPQTVNSGDLIDGSIQSNCAAGTASCQSWNVVTKDATTGVSSTLSKTSGYGQTFNWAFGGVLEVYSVTSCGDYPADGGVGFSNIALYDVNKKLISNANLLQWQPDLLIQQGTCNYNVNVTPSVTSLTY